MWDKILSAKDPAVTPLTETIMTKPKLLSRSTRRGYLPTFACTITLLCLLTVVANQPAHAQTVQVLHAFTNGSDGSAPFSTVTLDRAGNLYGTTYGHGNGNVYELQRKGSNWIFKTLYNFRGQDDGGTPQAPVVFGPDGTLYGTTVYGGNTCFSVTCGTVFNLRPPAHFCGNVNCPWTEHPVYLFGGGQTHDGYHPSTGPLAFDAQGNLYGTTSLGGQNSNGIVFQLVRGQNGWTENILDNFQGQGAPGQPQASVTLDALGNLYGTAQGGFGKVYAVINNGQSWMEQTIYSFQGGNDGAYPQGGIIFDAAGNAYGTTKGNDGDQPGSVFQLTPMGDGTWHETVLHLFTTGYGPTANLAMDAAGNLYGTTQGLGGFDGDRFGMAFRLSQVNGSWVFTDLHDFTDGEDGAYPNGGVTLDAAGNLYGTCVVGGASGFGTIWEITP